MANDRLHIQCPVCGDCSYLFKWYPNGPGIGGFWEGYSPDDLTERTQNFLNKHSVECLGNPVVYEKRPFVIIEEVEWNESGCAKKHFDAIKEKQ